MKSEKDYKKCENCYWSRQRRDGLLCNHTNAPDLDYRVEVCRSPGAFCGPKGKFFQPRPMSVNIKDIIAQEVINVLAREKVNQNEQKVRSAWDERYQEIIKDILAFDQLPDICILSNEKFNEIDNIRPRPSWYKRTSCSTFTLTFLSFNYEKTDIDRFTPASGSILLCDKKDIEALENKLKQMEYTVYVI